MKEGFIVGIIIIGVSFMTGMLLYFPFDIAVILISIMLIISKRYRSFGQGVLLSLLSVPLMIWIWVSVLVYFSM
jgi:hypothetical protein